MYSICTCTCIHLWAIQLTQNALYVATCTEEVHKWQMDSPPCHEDTPRGELLGQHADLELVEDLGGSRTSGLWGGGDTMHHVLDIDLARFLSLCMSEVPCN